MSICCECNTTTNLIAIYDKDDENTEQYICKSCVKNNDAYGYCWCCGEDEHCHYADDLNSNNECSIHKGESEMDPEDREGWEHNIRKWNEE